jgi:hypothetical protein
VVLMGAAGAEAEVQRYKDYEQAPYAVVQAEGAVEIRDYAPKLIAEVTVEGDRPAAANRGFRVLAGYIFGGNEPSEKVAMTVPVTQAPAEKIAMTVPVTQAGAGADLWTVQFMMPSTYGLDTLPKAKDDRIRFFVEPARREAVLRFAGIPTEGALARHEDELRSWLEARGLSFEEPVIYHFYDAPFTLPWNRRNEVAFRLR